MIVRIQGEGQYELADGSEADLQSQDQTLFDAMNRDDVPRFQSALKSIVSYVQSKGARLSDERLVGSDVILPSPDTSLEEAKRLFTDEGYLKPIET